MPVKKIELPDIGTIHIYKRRGTKSIRLSISHSGQIKMSLPPWVPYRLGIEFAMRKQEWLQQKSKQPVKLKNGDRIGRSHWILFYSNGRKAIATRITRRGEIRVGLPLGIYENEDIAQAAAARGSIRALKSEAEVFLPGRVYALARQYGFNYKSVSVKRLSSRWGSCSDQKNIVLNCYLMQLPNELIDYVILHELLHTKIMAHGVPFWTELARFVPNLANTRKNIRQYRPVLMPQ